MLGSKSKSLNPVVPPASFKEPTKAQRLKKKIEMVIGELSAGPVREIQPTIKKVDKSISDHRFT